MKRNIIKTSSQIELEKKYDIESFRKKVKRKKWVLRGLIGLLAVIIIATVFFIGETVVQNKIEKSKFDATFPINLKGENPFVLETFRNYLVMSGDAQTIFYNSDASKETSIAHGLAKPVVKVSGNKILSYAEGAYIVRLDNQKGEIKTLKLEVPVLFCEISDNGYVAVVTFEERFNAALTIYNPNLKEVYKYNESQNYITSFDFVNKNKGIVTMQTAEGGEMGTLIRGLDFRKEEDTQYFEKKLDAGIVVYRTRVKNTGNIMLTTNRGMITLDEKGNDKESYLYNNHMRFINDEKSDTVLALENFIDSNETDIIVFSDMGKEKAKMTLSSTVTDIYVDEGRIILLDKTKAYLYDHNLRLLGTYDNARGCIKVTVLEGELYAMTTEYLYRLKSLE